MASGRYVGFPEARTLAQGAVQSQAQLQPLRKISCRFQNENDYFIFFKNKVCYLIPCRTNRWFFIFYFLFLTNASFSFPSTIMNGQASTWFKLSWEYHDIIFSYYQAKNKITQNQFRDNVEFSCIEIGVYNFFFIIRGIRVSLQVPRLISGFTKQPTNLSFLRNILGFLVCLCFLLCGFCCGRFVVEKNSLKLTSPESLKGVYECAIANFGVPQYGGTLVGTVVYPKANQKACKGFDEVDISFKSRPGGLPTFVLADRGG